MKLTQKAAMFGLDARVALAIFGALSVITGVMLYKVIREAKIISMIAIVKEVEKAYEAFYLDVGSHAYRFYVNGGDSVYVRDLLIKPFTASKAKDWKGPYLPYEYSSVRDGFVTEYEEIILRARNTQQWGGSTDVGSRVCTDNSDCFLWIGWLVVPTDLVKEIDNRIDGVIDGSTGKVRYGGFGSGSYIYIKTLIKYPWF
ncbi:MAG: hypothetical protein GY793_08825 [Proteobacteria bacterium]|nr:hypothetical protein [Pseudomonadota bacterium]